MDTTTQRARTRRRNTLPATGAAVIEAAELLGLRLGSSGLLDPLLQLSLTHPDRIVEPDSWVGHIPFAFWIVAAHRPGTLIELGAHSGNSYCAFCQAVAMLRLDAACYAVDTWQGDPQAGYYGEEVYAELSRYHDARYAAFSRLVRSTFDDAVAHFPDHSIDLLHIDGYHVYDAVRHDFETWLPKLSSRGIVLLHDINVRERDFGAWRFWREASSDRPHFAFQHSHGLGVLVIGEEMADAVRALCTGPETHAVAVRQWFSTTARSVQSELALARMRPIAQERDELAAALGAEARHRSELEASLQDGVRRHAEFEAALRAEVHALTSQRDALRAELDAAVQELAAVQAHAEANLQERLAALRSELRRATYRHNALEAEIQTARQSLANIEPRLEVAIQDRAGVECRAEKLEAALTKERAERVTERQRLTKLDKRLARIKKSATWRYTRWLRLIKTAVKRKVRGHNRKAVLPSKQAAPTSIFNQDQSERDLLASSGLIGTTWYRRHSSVRLGDHVDPVDAYLQSDPDEPRFPAPFFDAEWYRERYPDVIKSQLKPLSHYLRHGAQDARLPHFLFDPAAYRSRYGDLGAEVNPLQHYLLYGAREGRIAFGEDLFSREGMREELSQRIKVVTSNTSNMRIRRDNGVAIYVNSNGNIFFLEIANILSDGLRELGVRTSLNDEKSYDSQADIHLVVAPHEYFLIGEDRGCLLLDSKSRLCMYCTEQWHTPWFARSLEFVMHAEMIFDISLTSAAAFQSIGVPAVFLPPGLTVQYDPILPGYEMPEIPGLEKLRRGPTEIHLYADRPFEDRPLDFAFIGSYSERRGRALALSAPVLSRHRGFIHIPPPTQPLRVGSTALLDSRDLTAVLRQTKVLVNIHQSEAPYFEWHRIVNLGIGNGCIVLTEDCDSVPHLVPGEHFLNTELEMIAPKLQWLLETPEGRARGAAIPIRAREAVAAEYSMASLWARVLTVVD